MRSPRVCLSCLLLLWGLSGSFAAEAPSSLLDGVFRSKLTEEQAGDLGEGAALKDMVSALLPGQKAKAREDLAYLERAKDAGTLREVGRGYLLLGLPRDAARAAERLKELEPESAQGYSLAADAAYRLGDFEGASQDARRALEIKPKDSNMRTLLRFSESKLGRGRSAGARLRGAEPMPEISREGEEETPLASRRGTYGKALGKRERLLVDQGINRLFRTKTGRRFLVEVVPGADAEATLKTLEESNVDVRRQESLGGKTQKVEREGDVYVILLPREAFEERGTLAPALGEGIGEVRERIQRGNDFSLVLIRQKAALVGIWITEELRQAQEPCEGDGWLCQSLNVALRIWKDDLVNNPMGDNEFTTDSASGRFKMALKSERKHGRRGTDEILSQTWFANKGELSAEVMRRKRSVTEEDENERDNYLGTLKLQDSQFRREPVRPRP